MKEASLELLAPREHVWAFLAEPYHLPDWWPGITGVEWAVAPADARGSNRVSRAG